MADNESTRVKRGPGNNQTGGKGGERSQRQVGVGRDGYFMGNWVKKGRKGKTKRANEKGRLISGNWGGGFGL
jgi:hypothetical protein